MNKLVRSSDRPFVRTPGTTIFQYWDLLPFLSMRVMGLWGLYTGIRPERVMLALADP